VENRTYTSMQEIRDLVSEVFARFQLSALGSSVKIEFNNKFDARMGDASYFEHRIRFSAPLWPRATSEERRQVIIHEACHIIAQHMFWTGKTKDNTSHGPCWKQCMLMCGVKPDRCHTVSTKGLRDRVEAVCDCKTWEITKNRATFMSKGRTYFCQNCRGPLRLKPTF
jgi:SprT protein